VGRGVHAAVGVLLLVERPAAVEGLDLAGWKGRDGKVRALAVGARGVGMGTHGAASRWVDGRIRGIESGGGLSSGPSMTDNIDADCPVWHSGRGGDGRDLATSGTRTTMRADGRR